MAKMKIIPISIGNTLWVAQADIIFNWHKNQKAEFRTTSKMGYRIERGDSALVLLSSSQISGRVQDKNMQRTHAAAHVALSTA